ncbi:MAG TPA: PKD domain-containing protein [Myxococcales bacterium]
MKRARPLPAIVQAKLLPLLLFAASIAASPVRAQTTIVLQQGLNGYAGTSDSKIALGKPTTNIGADSVNDLIVDSSTSLLVRFAIFQSEGGPVPNNASIISATLSHYKPWGPDAVFKANRVLKDWTELGVTWTLTGTGATWTTAGVFDGDILATPDGQGSVAAQPPVQNTVCDVNVGWPDTCWLNIDVTAGVQAFAAGTPNFGWKLSFVSSTADPSKPKSFYAKEITCCNREIRRPKLTISYRSPPTASFAASPSSGAAPLAVSFDASATTDGGSPITNLRLQFGDGSPDANWTDKTQIQSHTYSAAGTYTATITATNAIGTSPPATQAITVSVGTTPTPPTANFTATPPSGVAPLAVTFDASSSADGTSPITSLTLQFGDGQQVTWSSKTTTQPHTYAAAGNYTATLTATSAAGTSAPATRAVTVATSTNTSCNASTRPAASGVAVPTFHSMSVYYNPPTAPSGDSIFLRYRRGSDPDVASSWRQGHPLWYDSRTVHAYHGRGSVVHLDAGTPYVFEVSTDNVNWQYVPGMQAETCPATWSESFPAGAAGPVWSGPRSNLTTFFNQTKGQDQFAVLLANQSGTAAGYTVYDFTGLGASANAPNSLETYGVIVSGSYMIIKGLKIVGGSSGIFIEPGSHDVVIDNVEITGYARDSGQALPAPLTGNRGVDEDGGIKFPDSAWGPITDTRRIVIQHSRIHNPAFGSSPWQNGGIHPQGPTAIMMYATGGQIVIRYNEAYATTDGNFGGPPDLNHYHQDGLVMGGCNSGCVLNGIGPDVDIYKNRVMNYMDDGLEIDGDATNDRVWRNYFDYGGASAVSTAPVTVGPAYVWRNVYNRQRECISDDWGNSSCNGGGRDPMHKNGGNGANTGKTYIYHNTSLQPPASSEGLTGNPLGAGGGSGGGPLVVTRNNVFEIWKQNWNGFNTTGGDVDYDLTNASCWTGSLPACSTTETNGFTGTTPQYQNQNATDGTANGWRAYWNGRYRLVPGTPGYDDGVVIPNFNDGYVGAKPDRGAHEDGTPDMDFGPAASGS